MGGTAGWLEVVLFVLGIGCIGLEIFVVPGFGVFGVSGILMVIAALVMAGHSWSFDTTANVEELVWQTGQVMLAFGVVGVLGAALARFLPSMPGFDSMVLGPPGAGTVEPQLRGDGMMPAASDLYADLPLGGRGQALTMLRPSGKAKFENRVVDVVSEGPFISAESEVEIVAISGNRIVVRQV